MDSLRAACAAFLDGDLDGLERATGARVVRFQELEPSAAQILGSELPVWLDQRVIVRLGRAFGKDDADILQWMQLATTQLRTDRLTEDGTVKGMPDGTALVRPETSRQERTALENYHRSLGPAKPIGRPRKLKSRTGAPAPIPLDVAIAVREMKRSGARNYQISQRYFPALDKDAARKRIERYIHRANLERLE